MEMPIYTRWLCVFAAAGLVYGTGAFVGAEETVVDDAKEKEYYGDVTQKDGAAQNGESNTFVSYLNEESGQPKKVIPETLPADPYSNVTVDKKDNPENLKLKSDY